MQRIRSIAILAAGMYPTGTYDTVALTLLSGLMFDPSRRDDLVSTL